MAVLEGAVSAALAGVGAESGSGLHVTLKPTPPGALGHYRTSHRCNVVANQAANSRLFELRNAHASNLIVIQRLRITVVETSAHTAALDNSLDVYRLTSFSVSSTTGTVTPVASKLRTSYAAIDTAATLLRGVTVAGAAAGMTGATLTKDTAPLFQVPIFYLAVVPTAGPTVTSTFDYTPAATGESPLVLAQNEGFLIENRALFGAAGQAAVYIDVAWAEVTAY